MAHEDLTFLLGAPVRDIRDLISYRLTHLVTINDRAAHAFVSERFGLTLGEWRTLATVQAIGPVLFGELVREMIIDKAQLSRTLKLLAGKKLTIARRDHADRRTLIVSITPKGRTLHDKVLAFAIERHQEMLAVLEPAERTTLVRLVDKLLHQVEREVESVVPKIEQRDSAAPPAPVRRRSGK